MVIFFLLLLIVRGLPSLLVYRRALAARPRVEVTFITATTLPLLIALAEIGEQDGVISPPLLPPWSARACSQSWCTRSSRWGCTGQRRSPRGRRDCDGGDGYRDWRASGESR